MATVTYNTLRNFNLNNGVKSKYLSVEATKVDVQIEIDSALDDLIKAGKESLKINHLGDVAKAEIDKSAARSLIRSRTSTKKSPRTFWMESRRKARLKRPTRS